MDSIEDPEVGTIFDPKSLVQSLTSLIGDYRNSCSTDKICALT